MASLSSGGRGEPLSPGSRLFHSPNFNCHVIAVLGFKTTINPQLFKEGFRQTVLKHPRFTSKLVNNGSRTEWISSTIDLDSHIIVPEINSSEIEFPDTFVKNYISNLTKVPLDITKPLWELHLLNIKTSDADSVGVFRMHHSMGDGISLMSLIIANTRKSSDPDALPTMPSSTKKKEQKRGGSRRLLMSLFGPLLAVWWALVLMWHTFVNLLMGILGILFLKETWTPLKGAPGVEHNTNCFVHRIVCINDIKLLKREMNTTFNDVLLAITQAGITRYLNRQRFEGANANGSAAKKGSSVLKNIRLRAAIIVNLRAVAGIQAVRRTADLRGRRRASVSDVEEGNGELRVWSRWHVGELQI
ncbi:hypothetical protein PIB30_056354 [Stylosanthes scabra]|uniref:diacylglycerol O-acyltransferase n=1 Tax=Stylosanthes scabra TaxID=79078 RepID=A0ABU6ZI13_9FABA|nr:hypothetical protein [Stylosanthes scabra]